VQFYPVFRRNINIFSRAIQNYSHVQSGDIFKRGASLYLDQNFSLLNPELNAVHNLQLLNPSLSDEACRNQLGQLRIRRDKALLPISLLSGGEQLKVALLCICLAAQPVDLLLLDEPENHLDIDSRQLLAQAI
jgi:ATPase subunit of ABC transporter with duplicated ATPase domains